MKNNNPVYEEPKIEVICFSGADIITSSLDGYYDTELEPIEDPE